MYRQILLRWERNTDNRYYLALLYRDLLGDLVLTKVWGGIGKATGQQHNTHVNTVEDGLALIDQIIRKRKQRGYELVNGLAYIQEFAYAA
jgi:predicted DNA-binding WGR domain protein